MPFDRDKLAVLVSLVVLGWTAPGGAQAAPESTADAAALQTTAPSERAPVHLQPPTADWICNETSCIEVQASSATATPAGPTNDSAVVEAADAANAADTAESTSHAGGPVPPVVLDQGLETAETARLPEPLPLPADLPVAEAGGAGVQPTNGSRPVAQAAPPDRLTSAAAEPAPRPERAAAVDAVDAVEGVDAVDNNYSNHPWQKVAAVLTDAPASTAPQVIVASHADRVLLGLAELLGPPEPAAREATARSAQPQQIVVTSHADKVLATLDQVRANTVAETPPPVDFELDFDSRATVSTGSSAADAGLATIERWASLEQRHADADAKRAPRSQTARVASGTRPMAGAALDPNQLDAVRGGFDTGNGLKVSFGIERAVYINGNLVTTTNLSVIDPARLSAGGAPRVATIDSGNLTLIQNGAGSVFNSSASPTAVATVIQNTLNNQSIRNVTVIDAAVNSAQIARGLSLQSTLRNVAIDALRR